MWRFLHLQIEKLSKFRFMFFDRYEIHTQAFLYLINGNLIIFNPHLHKNMASNALQYFSNVGSCQWPGTPGFWSQVVWGVHFPCFREVTIPPECSSTRSGSIRPIQKSQWPIENPGKSGKHILLHVLRFLGIAYRKEMFKSSILWFCFNLNLWLFHLLMWETET